MYEPPVHAKALGTVKLALAVGTVYVAGVLVTSGFNCAVTEMLALLANAGTETDHVPPAMTVVVIGVPPLMLTEMMAPVPAVDVPLTVVAPAYIGVVMVGIDDAVTVPGTLSVPVVGGPAADTAIGTTRAATRATTMPKIKSLFFIVWFSP